MHESEWEAKPSQAVKYKISLSPSLVFDKMAPCDSKY